MASGLEQRMTGWRRVLTLVLTLFFPLGCSKSLADDNLEKQATAFLLDHYDTLVSARSTVLSSLKLDDPNLSSGPKFLSLPFVYLMGGLKALGPNAIRELEGASDIVLTGAKDFVRPSGLGMVRYRMCTIALLGPGARQVIAPLFSKVKTETIDGRPSWNWSRPPSEGYETPIDFYAGIVANSFFLLTVNMEDFREAANALASGNLKLGLLNDAELVSVRAHAYWAYRRIPRAEAGERPDTLAAGISTLPASVHALELFTQYEDGRLFFTVLAPNDRSASAPGWLPSSDSIHFQRTKPGAWQAEISLRTNQTPSALLQVLPYFGYGVFF
jgi:hypothetical protein